MTAKKIFLTGFLILATNVGTALIVSQYAEKPEVPRPAAPAGLPEFPAEKLLPSKDIQVKLDALMQGMTIWRQIPMNDKIFAIRSMKELFQIRENTAMLQADEVYVEKIGQLLDGSPEMAGLSLPALLKVASVMDYDFYNGQDKEDLAKEILGEQLYEINRQRKAAADQQSA